MNASLNFKLPEEQTEFNQSANAGKLVSALIMIDNICRRQEKHGNKDTAMEAFGDIRDEIGEIFNLIY